MRSTLVFVSFVLIALLTAQTGLAQPDPASCPAVVEQALSQVTQNCANLGRNIVCYGFPRVAATFAEAVPADFFSRPADQAELFSLKSLETSPFNQTAGEWGIALLKIQANVPDTLPGQSVTFVLLGDIAVENAVELAAAKGVPPVTITTLEETDIWNNPGGQIINSVPGGTVMQASAQSVDSAWLAVSDGVVSGWMVRDAIADEAETGALPVIGQPRLSPMQAFYLRSSPGQAVCEQAPSVLAIQSPQGITVDLTVNGASIRLGSLILVRIIPPGNIIQVTTVEGLAIFDADTPDEVRLPAGWTTRRCLDTPANLGTDGQSNDRAVGDNCVWQPPEPVTEDEQNEIELILRLFEQLNTGETIKCPTGVTLIHQVEPGETLFRIARRYRTSVAALVAANNLADPARITSGQSLTIPCGVDTGLPSIPPAAPEVTNPVDCSRFAATSPLDGLPYGSGTFYWNPAPGATGYRLNIYNEDDRPGAQVASVTVDRNTTSVTLDLSINAIGYGFRFSWEVVALLPDGSTACASGRATVPRSPPPTDAPPLPTPEATPPPTPFERGQ